MIEIKNTEDIKLIKELAEAFNPNDFDVEMTMESIIDSINTTEPESLEEKYQTLLKRVDLIAETQKGCLLTLDKVLKVLENLNVSQKEVKQVSGKKSPKKETRTRNADKIFTPYQVGREEYQLVLREKSDLVHIFTANKKNGTQKHLLPINIFELLIIVESYIKGERSLLNSEVNEFCKMFGITRAQFSKIYYNLSVGKFDGILTEIDKMISDSVFTLKKSHIYRNDHDINIDKSEFNELLSIYANNTGNSFLAIYKLIKERSDIDPFDLLITLKKSGYVSKAVGE